MFNCGKDINKRSLPEQIILTATRLESFANRYIFEPTGITSPAIKIMGILAKHGEKTPTEIMNLLGSTKSNITQRLNWLEKKKFIVRNYAKNSSDKRQIMVSLTESGYLKLKSIAKIMKKSQFNLSKYFTKKELASIGNFFIKVNKLVDENQSLLNIIK